MNGQPRVAVVHGGDDPKSGDEGNNPPCDSFYLAERCPSV
jgi:hypothetical protein